MEFLHNQSKNACMSLTERQEGIILPIVTQLIEKHISLTKWQKGEIKLMARIRGLTANQIAKRIYNREDNVYDKKVITKQLITSVLLMYMDECRKALAEGERIEISKVGSIIPEVKVHEGNFNLPMCNKDGGNPPYTKLKITRNNLLGETMNRNLLRNIENGIYGLDKLPFSKQQMDILKKSGYIPKDAVAEDAEIENGDEE